MGPAPVSARNVYVVLGMHKSGTTLIAELLHSAGIDMAPSGGDGDGYDSGERFERFATVQINKDWLACGDTSSERVRRVLDPASLTAAQWRAGRAWVASMTAGPDSNTRWHGWGFKCPRTCLTYAAWARLLPAHRVVLVYRAPEEVLGHYQRTKRRGSWTPGRAWRRMRMARAAMAAWTVYNVEALRAVKQVGPGRALVVDYARLMSEPGELDRLSRFLGRTVPERRRPAMRREKPRKTLTYRLIRLRLVLGGRSLARIIQRLDVLAMGLPPAPPTEL